MLYRWLSEQPFVRSNTQDGRYSYHDLAKELFSRHLYQRSKKEYYTTRRALSEHYQRLLEEVHMAEGKGAYDADEWLDLTIAVAQQWFLLPDEVSHFKAAVQLLKADEYLLDATERKGEIVKLLRELSRNHVTNLALPGARQIAEHMLLYIETEPGSQEHATAIAPLLEQAVHVPSFPLELLASLYSEQGWAYFFHQSYRQAIAEFEHALQLDPRCAKAYNGRGWSYLLLTQYQQAKPDFDRALELNPNEAGAYNGRGNIYRELKEYRLAKADFDRLIKMYPKLAWGYVQRGRTCADLKEYQQAIADFERALGLDPYNPFTYKGLRQVYVELKEHQRAMANFNRIIEINPDRDWAYFQRGHTYLFLKDIEQARMDFTRSWELNSTNLRGRWMTEWSGMCQERYDTTTPERLEAIAAIDPRHATAHVCQAVAWWLRGCLEEAMAELEQATLLDPNQWDPEWDPDPFFQQWDPYFWKGMVCASLRRDEEAIAAIEQSLELELPPVLLAPLRWLELERPDFYEKFVIPLLARYEGV